MVVVPGAHVLLRGLGVVSLARPAGWHFAPQPARAAASSESCTAMALAGALPTLPGLAGLLLAMKFWIPNKTRHYPIANLSDHVSAGGRRAGRHDAHDPQECLLSLQRLNRPGGRPRCGGGELKLAGRVQCAAMWPWWAGIAWQSAVRGVNLRQSAVRRANRLVGRLLNAGGGAASSRVERHLVGCCMRSLTSRRWVYWLQVEGLLEPYFLQVRICNAGAPHLQVHDAMRSVLCGPAKSWVVACVPALRVGLP